MVGLTNDERCLTAMMSDDEVLMHVPPVLIMCLLASGDFVHRPSPGFCPWTLLEDFRPRFLPPLTKFLASRVCGRLSAAVVAKLLRSERTTELLAQFVVQPHVVRWRRLCPGVVLRHAQQ